MWMGMIILFMVVSFVIGCVDPGGQLFLSECIFFDHSFWPCCYGFLTFRCLWVISFSGQMISGTVSWLLGLDSDHMIILVELSVAYWA